MVDSSPVDHQTQTLPTNTSRRFSFFSNSDDHGQPPSPNDWRTPTVVTIKPQFSHPLDLTKINRPAKLKLSHQNRYKQQTQVTDQSLDSQTDSKSIQKQQKYPIPTQLIRPFQSKNVVESFNVTNSQYNLSQKSEDLLTETKVDKWLQDQHEAMLKDSDQSRFGSQRQQKDQSSSCQFTKIQPNATLPPIKNINIQSCLHQRQHTLIEPAYFEQIVSSRESLQNAAIALAKNITTTSPQKIVLRRSQNLQSPSACKVQLTNLSSTNRPPKVMLHNSSQIEKILQKINSMQPVVKQKNYQKVSELVNDSEVQRMNTEWVNCCAKKGLLRIRNMALNDIKESKRIKPLGIRGLQRSAIVKIDN